MNPKQQTLQISQALNPRCHIYNVIKQVLVEQTVIQMHIKYCTKCCIEENLLNSRNRDRKTLTESQSNKNIVKIMYYLVIILITRQCTLANCCLEHITYCNQEKVAINLDHQCQLSQKKRCIHFMVQLLVLYIYMCYNLVYQDHKSQ